MEFDEKKMNEVLNDRLRYDQLNEDNIKALKEVIRILEEYGLDDLVEDLNSRFGFENIPSKQLDDFESFKWLEESGIRVNKQGDVLDGGVKYPLVGIFCDMRQFEEAFKTKLKARRFGF